MDWHVRDRPASRTAGQTRTNLGNPSGGNEIVSHSGRGDASQSTFGHFLAGSEGKIFVLLRRPPGCRQCVLVVPPFAEEMNKSRRMVTDVALRLAQRGFATAFPDLYGTGDSSGDLSDATWGGWIADLAAVVKWLTESDLQVSGVIGIRLGAALANAATRSGALRGVERTVLWQPVFDGSRSLAQFLRLRTAASLLQDDRKESRTELRSRLQGGEILEVAGYPLAWRLAQELDEVVVPVCLPQSLGFVTWMEVVQTPGAVLPPQAARLVDQSRASHVNVRVQMFVGEPFWAATEIVHVPEMVAATIEALVSESPRPAAAVDGPG